MATKKKKPRAKARAAGPAARNAADRAIEAALRLAAAHGWRPVTMAAVAGRAGLDLGALLGLFPTKAALVHAFFRRIDGRVLAGECYAPDAPEPVRDRLFDVLMRRFDALAPHKKAVAAILNDTALDPLAALCGLCRVWRSMALMLEAAGLDASGLVGLARAKGLALVYLNALRVWLRDDTADMAKTMAALDKGLKRAEAIARLCAWRPGPGAAGKSAAT